MVALSANVMSTRAPASVVPVRVVPAANSLALMASPADTPTSATLGAAVSTVMARVPAALALPAASVCVALRVSAPCPMAVMSALTKV